MKEVGDCTPNTIHHLVKPLVQWLVLELISLPYIGLIILVLTMVDCQNLPTVHLDKAAQRKLGVINPQLLRSLKGDPLQTKPNHYLCHIQLSLSNHQLWSQTDLMVVVVHKASYHIGLFWVQLFQHVGRVGC